MSISQLFRALVTQIYRRVVAGLYLHMPLLLRIHRPVIDRGTYRLLLSPTRFALLLYRYPELPRDDEQSLAHFLEPGMTYVDVGANIGTTTLAAAHAVGPTGRVIAFEPHPETFRNLAESVALNPELAPRIILIDSAVGDSLGTTCISDLPENDVNHIDSEGIPVTLTTLDHALADLTHIDLIKIDVEGYEKNVLAGARSTLAKTDAVYFENCAANFAQFGYSADDLFDIFTDSGFTCYTVDSSDFGLSEVRKGRHCVGAFENLLAFRTGQLRHRVGATGTERVGSTV
jgi:FkbM family methyltransferase